MFAVYGTNFDIMLKQHIEKQKLEFDLDLIKQQVAKRVKRKSRIKLSPVFSTPKLCEEFIKLAKKDPNNKNLIIMFYLHEEKINAAGKTYLSKRWVKYAGEKTLLDLKYNCLIKTQKNG